MDKVLKIFIEQPEREFHVREVARIIKKSPTTASKYLQKSAKEGILTASKRLNHLLFKANTESNNFKQLKKQHNLSLLHKSGLIEFLKEEFGNPEAIGIFGSFAKAENIKESDIDLFIISSVRKELDLSKFEKKIGYKIQLFVFSRKEIEKLKNENKEMLNSILNGTILYGYLEVFR